jgi:hypothetical protein
MKTAVEWFANRISHGGLVSKKQFDELLEQAKEMEKKEREKIFKQAQECAVKHCGVYFKYESFEQLENNTN